MKIIKRIIFYIVCSLLAIFGCGMAVIFSILLFFSSSMPDHNSLKKYSPDLSSRVFLKDGKKLCEYWHEKRYFIPIEGIPKKVINAFLAAEDKNFFMHHGVDFMRVCRSLIKNIENIGSEVRPQGASTITQQVARIFFIKNNEISYVRKIKEAILAFRIESALTKKQILELYLNQIFFGLGTYGIATAAKAYFDKTVNELTISECSYLASLAKGANNYHPVKYHDKAIHRKNWVIRRQLIEKFITKKEAREALEEDLIIAKHIPNEKADYFAEELRKNLIEKLPNINLTKEGLIVRATLDSNLQKCAYNALRSGLLNIDKEQEWRGAITNINIKNKKILHEILKEIHQKENEKNDEIKNFLTAVVVFKNDEKIDIITEENIAGILTDNSKEWIYKQVEHGDVIYVQQITNKKIPEYELQQIPLVQGAIVVVEVNTGRILAMQCGYSFKQSEYNRATQAKRQTGSAFKPIVYLTALENGFAPNSIIDASPVEIDLGGNYGIWKPKNYAGKILDRITMRRAIERSVNTATIRLAQEVGMKKIAKFAKLFNVDEKMPPYLSYALGAGQTTLLQLTTAYAMFANGGKRIKPTMIDYILDKHGNIVYKTDQRTVISNIQEQKNENYSNVNECNVNLPPKLNDNREQIVNEQSIYQLNTLLEGVILRGSGVGLQKLEIPIAGKTGTSNDCRDAWFIGYTTDIAVGVFIGFDDHSKSLGKYATGFRMSMPIFKMFMENAKKYMSPSPFRVPKGIKLRKIDMITGCIPNHKNKNPIILEAFKENDVEKEQKLIQAKTAVSQLLENSKKNNDENIKTISGVY